MMLLDPFYGVFKPGVMIAKWLNRALLLYEVASIATLLYALYKEEIFPLWSIFIALPASFLVIHVVNLILRGLWNIVVVIVHGTTDADTILESHQAKEERRRKARIYRNAYSNRQLPANKGYFPKPEDYYPDESGL